MSLVVRTGRVFAHSQPTDMRKSFDTLAAIVRLEVKQDLLAGDLFVFIGRDTRRAKILFWDGTGTCLFAKRIEKGRFAVPGRPPSSRSSSRAAIFSSGGRSRRRPGRQGSRLESGASGKATGPLNLGGEGPSNPSCSTSTARRISRCSVRR